MIGTALKMFQTRIMEEYEWSKDPTDHGVPPEWFKIVKEGDTYYVKSDNAKLEIYTTPEKGNLESYRKFI